ncbi:MAG: GNAT family N-acetyltransferase [Deltaproteobacteria bacterium]
MSELSFVASLAAAAGVEGWSEASLAETLAHPGTVAVVQPPVGFALGRLVLDEAELLLIVIDPEHRRRGAGRRLLADFEAEVQTAGGAVVHLEVAARNAAARALYAAADYRPVGRRAGYYQDGDDAVLLEKTLAARNPT